MRYLKGVRTKFKKHKYLEMLLIFWLFVLLECCGCLISDNNKLFSTLHNSFKYKVT